MPESRTERIARLEASTDRTPRQDEILTSDKAYAAGVAKLGELVATWRDAED